MTREGHARFWERPEVKFLRATRQTETSKSEWSTSVRPPAADLDQRSGLVSFVPILLKKSFWGGDRNFLGPLMRFVRGDTRDHIISCKNDHGASYRRYGVLHWWCRLKINVCEIFGAVRFSTFAISARRRHVI